MASFPLMWEEKNLGPVAEDGCPVTWVAIANYLDGCSYHYLLDDEPPPTFSALTQVDRRNADGCEFWVWTCEDSTGRPWYAVAGSGPEEPKRWVLAEERYGRSVEEFFADTFADLRLARGTRS
jgi:hypothetical protein